MHAADPTTGATLSFHELRDRPLDMIFSRLWFFGSNGPANPFISCQWREVFPSFYGRLVRHQGFL